MFYIRLNINGVNKYLYNDRVALYLPDGAKRFKSREAAERYMRGRAVAWQWWVVEVK